MMVVAPARLSVLVATFAVAIASLQTATATSAPLSASSNGSTARNAGTRCEFGAFVNEVDPKGLNVRAAPNVSSKILGKIPPNYVNKKDPSAYASRVEVSVLSSRDGWFLIEGATDNEQLTGKPPRPMFTGQGWVSGKKLVVKTQASKARVAPNPKADVAFLVGNVLDGDSLSKPGYLVACDGAWVNLDYSLSKLVPAELNAIKLNPAARKGAANGRVRGWVTRICAIQETSCTGLGSIPE